MVRYGRATLYMAGLVGMLVCLIITGGLGCVNSKAASTGVGVLLVIQTLINMTTIGPACYPIVAETPSGRLRAKTITIGVSPSWRPVSKHTLMISWHLVANRLQHHRHRHQLHHASDDLLNRLELGRQIRLLLRWNQLYLPRLVLV